MIDRDSPASGRRRRAHRKQESTWDAEICLYALFWTRGYRRAAVDFFAAAKRADDPAEVFANGEALYRQRTKEQLPKLDLEQNHHRAFWIKYGDVLTFPILPRHVDLSKARGEQNWSSKPFKDDESQFYQKFFVRQAARLIPKSETAYVDSIFKSLDGRLGGPTLSRTRELHLLRSYTREHFDTQLKRESKKGRGAEERFKESFVYNVGASRFIKNNWALKVERSSDDARHNDKVNFRREAGAVRAIGKLRLFEIEDTAPRGHSFLVNFDFSDEAICSAVEDSLDTYLRRQRLEEAEKFARRRQLLATVEPKIRAYRAQYGQDYGKHLDWIKLRNHYFEHQRIVELAAEAEFTRNSMNAERIWESIVEAVRRLRNEPDISCQRARDWVWATALPRVSELDDYFDR